VDVDGDGDTEVFVGDHEGKVYAWDTPGRVSEHATWPTFKYGPHRTGCRETEPISPAVGIHSPSAKAFRLLSSYPNPFNSTVRIAFEISDALRSSATLTIFSVSKWRDLKRKTYSTAPLTGSPTTFPPVSTWHGFRPKARATLPS